MPQQVFRIDFHRPLPIFPLPECLLLPHGCLPLHIFEPRYREMTRDVLDTHGLIAMATLAEEGVDPHVLVADAPPPAVRPQVCIGSVMRHHGFSDGRYHLMLLGICRARILQEVPHAPYRKALLEPIEMLPPVPVDLGWEDRLAQHRSQIDRLMADPLLREVDCVAAVRNGLCSEVPNGAFIDMAAIQLSGSSEQRYAYLSERSVHQRAHMLQQQLQTIRQSLGHSKERRATLAEDGLGRH